MRSQMNIRLSLLARKGSQQQKLNYDSSFYKSRLQANVVMRLHETVRSFSLRCVQALDYERF